MVKIAVLGAGINGLSCAVKIKEKYKNYQVTVISSDFSPNTTGDGSGGLWYPYLCGNTPNKQIIQWSGETLAFLEDLWKTGAVSICLQPFYEFYTEKEHFTVPEWLNMTYGYQILNSKQLEFFNQRYSRKYTAGLTFVTLVVPPTKLLDYFQDRFKEAGGKILQGKISSPQDPILKEFDVIINCTGLGARFLVSDEKLAPIRGQIMRVNAPWLNETIMDISAGNYIIPNVETCVLGGTNQESFDIKPDPKDTEHILEGCKKLVPGLEHAKITTEWVGLRPGRDAIRLEPEEVNGKLFIHNYGHGGSGFTLFWGCSNEVLQILETYLHKNNTSHRASKL